MIKNVIFDIGKVIAYIDYNEALDALIDNEKDKKFLIDNVLNSPEWEGDDLIDYGFLSLDEFISVLCDKFSNKKDDIIKGFIYGHYDYFKVNNKMLDLIKLLKNNGYKVYLLSNINEVVIDMFTPSGLFDIVDGKVLSCEVHQVKPNDGIYKTLLEKYNINPSESCFVDDRIDNIKKAETFSIKGLHVKPNNYDDVISKLKEININID